MFVLGRLKCCLNKINEFSIYLGIENLQGFCKQNQNFSTSLNPNAVTTNRESVRRFDFFSRKFFFFFLLI